jgi:serine phosphatase RsbU (regulator of sigma subunit)
LRRLCGRHPEAVADEVLADLDQFTDGAPRHDDQTLIVLRVR